MKNTHFLSFMIFMIMVVSCKSQDNEVLNGSIYIKQIDLGSLYKSNKEKINSLKKEIDNFDESKSNESEKLFYNYYKVLFEEDLIDKPCSLIKVKGNSIQRVFFSLDDYKEIESLLLNLDKNTEQINLSLKVNKINDGIYFANNIISLEKVEGKTDWKK